MHSYSNSLSTIATISSLIMSELFPACFSCSNKFNLLHSSSGSDHKNNGFDTPEAELGDLSNFRRVLYRVDFLPEPFTSKCISFAKSYINFLSDNLARSTLYFLLVIISKRSFFNLNSLPVSRNVKILLYRVIGIDLFIFETLNQIELESFTRVN